MSRRKTNINPNSTFITTKIQEIELVSYIDTGATLCFGRRKILKNWEKLEKPLKITLADKSIHKIWFVGRDIDIVIEKALFKTPTIYQHDSGIDTKS